MTSERYFESELLNRIRRENINEGLHLASDLCLRYVNRIDNRNVYPDENDIRNLNYLDGPLADDPDPTTNVIRMLDEYGSPATVAQTGPRYFGFVNGGILPASLGARWMADTWDQNAALYVMSPIASKLEQVCEDWLKDVLQLPDETGVGIVGGSSTATLCGLTAGRDYLLNRLGYDVGSRGLFGAPEIKVVLGEEAHSTIYKALSIIGLGSERIIKVPCDDQGRMRVDALPDLDERTLLILQAGNVNTGAFDDFEHICPIARERRAWIHVDGAFGLWARASDDLHHLTAGVELADSWSTDGHKTLNAPYDSGLILCKHKEALARAMHMTGSYIIYSDHRDGMLFTPDMSRRARSIELWATLKSLGKRGIGDLVAELHGKAQYFAELLARGGLEVLNDVVFNQVLVHFRDSDTTDELIRQVQASGVCWLGGASWQDKRVMRVSVSSYKTTYDDVERSAAEIVRIARELSA